MEHKEPGTGDLSVDYQLSVEPVPRPSSVLDYIGQNQHPETSSVNLEASSSDLIVQDEKAKDISAWKYSRFSIFQKNLATFIVSMGSFLVPLGGSVYLPTLALIEQDLSASATQVNNTIFVYMAFIGVIPLFTSPASDIYGRRGIYIVSMIIFISATIGSYFVPSISVLFFLRALQAMGSSVLPIGSGTISDLFDNLQITAIHERGRAIGWASLGTLLGPSIGPLLGSIITQFSSWRNTFLLLTAVGSALLIGFLFLLPETLVPYGYNPDTMPKITTMALIRGIPGVPKRSYNPVGSLAFLRYPSIYITLFARCVTFLGLVTMTTTLSRDFIRLYGFSACYMASGGGQLLGSLLGGYNVDRLLEKARKKAGEHTKPVPESRLLSALQFGWLATLGMLMYGWGIQYAAHPVIPLLGGFFLGVAMSFVFGGVTTYVVDIFPFAPASVLAPTMAIQFIISGSGSAFVQPAVDSMGYGWLYTLLAFLALVGQASLTWLYLYGEKIASPALAALGMFEPSKGAYVQVWVDTSQDLYHNDSCVATNQRLGKNISVFQFAQNIPKILPDGNNTEIPYRFIEATNTDAILFITIYPFLVSMDQITEADVQSLAFQMGYYNAIGRRVMLRLAPEMNGGWYSWGQKPSTYIPFWRRIYTAVKAKAPNVAFVWSPNVKDGEFAQTAAANSTDFKLQDTNNDGAVTMADDPYTPFYPGDQYVDWVGLSLYFYGTSAPFVHNVVAPSGWFDGSFDSFGAFDFYDTFCVKRDKPFSCSECSGTFYADGPLPSPYVAVPPGDGEVAIKRSWWSQTILSAAAASKYPRIKLWGLFEWRKFEDQTYRDFQILNGSNPTLAAFKADLASTSVSLIWANYTAPTTTPVANPGVHLATLYSDRAFFGAASKRASVPIGWLITLILAAAIIM
ncbi:mannan endo-1,4-beta-mannosidase [Synchytrium microbalum]|uniref:Mannan endo-1,4-beta-mannosidase n=1 Tax=Synchytrium microbalum TaxID=1806994 RepID=A0A507C4R3_9FUNG|nr:mannan endo-1,4-beta-mannosidase [Synchytrium microbalum]TPX34471.1 mannan endo-1,4-beta-mannosidase [Synchytrium microbalum]